MRVSCQPRWRRFPVVATPGRVAAARRARAAAGGIVLGLPSWEDGVPQRREPPMAMGLYFTPSSFTVAKYDDSTRKLEEAGAGSPPGRLYHVALETNGEIQVF